MKTSQVSRKPLCSVAALQFGPLHLPVRPLHLEPSPLVLDVVQDPWDSALLRPGQLWACRGTRSLGGQRTPAARRSIPPRGERLMFPPGPCCCRGGAAIPGPPPPPPPASSSIVRGAPAGAQGETSTAGGRAGEGGAALAAGRRPAGRRAGRGLLLNACQWVRAGSCRPPPLQSLLHLPVSLTHFRGRGGRGGRGKGGQGWEGERRRAAAPAQHAG